MTRLSVGLSFVLYLLVALTGYLHFRDSVEDNILQNFGDDIMAMNVSRILYAMTMVCDGMLRNSFYSLLCLPIHILNHHHN